MLTPVVPPTYAEDDSSSDEKELDPIYLRVNIRDTGRGIAQENLSRIFEEYFHIEAKNLSVKGSGLG